MGVSSEQSSNNMNRFVVACAFVACVSGAPQLLHHGVSTVGHASYAGPAQVTGVSHGPTVATVAPLPLPPLSPDRPTRPTLLVSPLLSSTPNMESSEARLSRPDTPA